MGKKDPPAPPKPQDTSAAQTGTNVATAVANTTMGNVNQYGPDGSLTYDQTGSTSFKDPFTGKSYDIPQFSATTQLSPQQQAIYDQQQGAELGMASTANIAGENLQSILGQNFNPKGLPAQGQIPGQSNFQSFGGNANLIDRNAQGGGVQRNIAGAGPVQGSVNNPNVINRDARGGQVQDRLSYQNQNQRGARGGRIQRGFGDAGDITRSYGADDFSADRQRVEQAIMDRMQPQMDQDRERLQTQLANQGIGVGSRAYSASQGDFSKGVNDARLGAILAGGQEQSRMVGMDRDRASFQNAAQNQQFGQEFQRGQFANAAQSQAYGQDANNIQMQNAARARNYNQNLGASQFANTAQAQRFGQDASNIAQRNAAAGQQFSQNLGAGQFANAAQSQRFGQNATQAQFGNAAQAQAFGQDAANIGQRNAVRQQGLDNMFRQTQGNNANLSQMFGQGMDQLNAQNSQRQQSLSEQFAMRNQPINEITALLSGSQVSMPNFQMNQPSRMPTTDNAGLINAEYNQRLNNFNNQQAQRQSLFGGLLGAGGNIGSAAILASDRRVKADIARVGEIDGLPVYSYRYLGTPQPRVGFMADEVERIMPNAVIRGVDGYAKVDYAQVLGAMA